MQNIVINMCKKCHYDWLQNDRALGNVKSDNDKKNNNKNNVGSAWSLLPSAKINVVRLISQFIESIRKKSIFFGIFQQQKQLHANNV